MDRKKNASWFTANIPCARPQAARRRCPCQRICTGAAPRGRRPRPARAPWPRTLGSTRSHGPSDRAGAYTPRVASWEQATSSPHRPELVDADPERPGELRLRRRRRYETGPDVTDVRRREPGFRGQFLHGRDPGPGHEAVERVPIEGGGAGAHGSTGSKSPDSQPDSSRRESTSDSVRKG